MSGNLSPPFGGGQMKVALSWAVWRGGWALAVCLAAAGQTLAQNAVTAAYLHGKAPVAPDAVTTLGPDLFGDKLNLYNGSFSFEQTDFELPGNSALRVALVRQNSPGRADVVRGAMGDWDLNTPRVEGTFAIPEGWVSAFGTAATRCSSFWSPPDVTRGSVDFSPSNYWQGVNLVIPGEGSQEVLVRGGGNPFVPADGASYPLVTKDNWQIRCLPSLLNAPGEGFFALSPQGLRYTFNWMASRRQTDLQAGEQRLARQDMFLMASRVEDRFGNWVQYTYDSANPLRLLRIEANDGRVVTLTYANGRVSSAFDGTRTWQYQYSSQGDLQFVVLPDGSRWQFNLRPFVHAEPFLLNEYFATCDSYPYPQHPTGGVGTITHPSGAIGTFTGTLFVNGRTNVDRVCNYAAGTDPAEGWTTGSVYQRWTTNQGLHTKSISGPGMPTMTWTYGNSGGVGGWAPCYGCVDRKTVTVLEPSGSMTRHTFGTRWRSNEGQLLRLEEGWDGSTALKTIDFRYREPAGQVFADSIGYSPWLFSDWLSTRNRPQDQRIITQQGVSFVWEANSQAVAFDAFARPLLARAWSSLGPSRSLAREYRDFASPWVLGQTQRVVETATGLEVERTEYHPTNGLPSAQYSFGRLTKRMEYNADGTLFRLVDPAGKTTTFQNFYRGQPQRAIFADGTFATQVVNNLGNASEYTNESGTTTRFWFDPMGRVSKVIYPPGDDEPYCDIDQSFVQSFFADRGMPAGHWRQTITTCNARTERWFDGFWRVRLERRQDLSNPSATGSTVETRFDAGGRKAFQSFPLRDIAQVDAVGEGTGYEYDALNRIVRMRASSELGVLTTSTDYLGNFTKRVTNPRGHASVFSFQVFDEPREDVISSVSLPEAVQVSLLRDVFGKANAIVRSGPGPGGTISATRSYTYDAFQRLCKTVEPETGATVEGYDLSGNVHWRVSGQPANAGCDEGQQPSGRKITFGHDLRNRLASTTFGDGRPSIARSYTPDGLLSSVQSSSFTWTYGYNNRRLLKSEAFSVPGQTPGSGWHFTRHIDKNGNVASLTDYWGTMNYAPNALGAPTQVSGYASGVSYHPNGMVTGYTLTNGKTRSVAPNARGLPAVWQDSGVMHEAYTYDANGNVTAISDYMPGGSSRSMDFYDGLDRLRSASGPWGSAAYSYDGLDNLRYSQVGARALNHEFADGSNRLTALTGGQNVPLSYDLAGNVVHRGGQGYQFDIANRMRAAPGVVSYYDYDGHGRRSWVVWADGKTQLNAYGYANASGSTGRLLFSAHSTKGGTRYVYLGDKLIAEHNNQTGVRFGHADALGSPVAWSSLEGGVSPVTRYEPYGATAAGPQPDTLGFTGHVNDPETGLVYMQQRYYDPIAGRFLSVDPVTTDANDGSSFNRYVYGNNNPYKYVDPDGRFANFAIGFVVGAAIEAVVQMARNDGAITNPNAILGAGVAGALTGGTAGVLSMAAARGAISPGVATAKTALVGSAAAVVGKHVEGAAAGAAPSGSQTGVAAVGGLLGGAAGGKIANAPMASMAKDAAKPGVAGHVGVQTLNAAQLGGKVSVQTSAGQELGKVGVDAATSATTQAVDKKLGN